MRLIIMGPPGAGKGTQAAVLSEQLGVPHISTGDLFRANIGNATPLGQKAKSYMDAGELVPDEMVLKLLKLRLEQPDAHVGFVLDGFPRTLQQAEDLDKALAEIDQAIDVVVYFDVPDELIVLRLSARASCPTCGRTYNMLASPPRDEMRCDRDGTALFQRDDDKPEVIQNRLAVFRRQTFPLIKYYEDRGLLRRVAGTGSEDEVTEKLIAEIGTGSSA